MSVNHLDIRARLRDYKPVMYRELDEPEEQKLRTGDIIRLRLDDFSKLLKHFEILKPLLESYNNNSKYESCFWAILNKPCDMVHGQGQKFKSNLFLCLLQSFRKELKQEHIFGEYVSPPQALKVPSAQITTLYQKYLSAKAKGIYPISNDLSKKEKAELSGLQKKFVGHQLQWATNEIFSYFEDSEQISVYDEVLSNYQEQVLSDRNKSGSYDHIIEFLANLPSNDEWQRYKKELQNQLDRIDEIRINSKKARSLVQTVFINQMETKGMFYFEPHENLYDEALCDFSYFIELEDILTLKLKDEVILNGTLVETLKEKRLVGLTRNYSDRLQNIMGYFFSKIGTKDVKGAEVLGIYDDCFNSFHYDKSSL